MVSLTLTLLNELGQQAGITTTRDAKTIAKRVEREGFSFLTIALPQFCADFEDALDCGYIGQHHFTGYRRDSAGIPKFLGGFLRELFPNGRLNYYLESGRAAALVRSVRQICQFMKKVELECSPFRVEKAYREYIELDHEIKPIPNSVMSEFREVARWLFQRYLGQVEAQLFAEWIPRYSGGALATRESFNGRFSSRVWTERLQAVLPHWDGLSFSYRDEMDNPVQILSQDEEIPSRVTHVPKTLKAPRIIAMEPVWNQSVQQVILAELTSVLSKPQYLELNLGMGWTMQDFNRYLAQVGSDMSMQDRNNLHGQLATLDLSSASDLVSNQLVDEGLLSFAPYLRELSQACRSSKANVNGEIISLNKFASMGSSLTFPYESMVFYTAITMAHQRYWGDLPEQPLGPTSGYRVYGDDLIVPVKVVPHLLAVLEDLGLRVNSRKSFWNGKFRESCGADWYDGWSVTPIRLSVPLPEGALSPATIRGLIEFHNNLVSTWLPETAEFVAAILRKQRYIPYGPPNTTGHCLWSEDESKYRVRYNPNLQRSEYRTLVSKEVKPLDPLSDWGAMMKWITPHTTREATHLTRDGRSQCVSLNIGWGTVA